MIFEWDNEKNQSNQAKHGIDFDTAKTLWNDENRVEIQSFYPLECRSILTGKLDKKYGRQFLHGAEMSCESYQLDVPESERLL